jgi:tubulin polyglutamylase TTLL1
LEGTHGRAATDELFSGINDCMIHSLRSVQNVIINDRHCFELYGRAALTPGGAQIGYMEVTGCHQLNRVLTAAI